MSQCMILKASGCATLHVYRISLGSWIVMAEKTRLRRNEAQEPHSVSEVPQARWQSVFGMRIRAINTSADIAIAVRREARSLWRRPGRLLLRPFKNGVYRECSPL